VDGAMAYQRWARGASTSAGREFASIMGGVDTLGLRLVNEATPRGQRDVTYRRSPPPAR
jgi:hypothetical protein